MQSAEETKETIPVHVPPSHKPSSTLSTSSSDEKAEVEQHQYPTGLTLLFILIGINVACFLTGLDVAIIGTVSNTLPKH